MCDACECSGRGGASPGVLGADRVLLLFLLLGQACARLGLVCAQLGLAWLCLAVPGMAVPGLAWLGLAVPGLAWLGLAVPMA